MCRQLKLGQPLQVQVLSIVFLSVVIDITKTYFLFSETYVLTYLNSVFDGVRYSSSFVHSVQIIFLVYLFLYTTGLKFTFSW